MLQEQQSDETLKSSGTWLKIKHKNISVMVECQGSTKESICCSENLVVQKYQMEKFTDSPWCHEDTETW
jgi:hypothetical protein